MYTYMIEVAEKTVYVMRGRKKVISTLFFIMEGASENLLTIWRKTKWGQILLIARDELIDRGIIQDKGK